MAETHVGGKKHHSLCASARHIATMDLHLLFPDIVTLVLLCVREAIHNSLNVNHISTIPLQLPEGVIVATEYHFLFESLKMSTFIVNIKSTS